MIEQDVIDALQQMLDDGRLAALQNPANIICMEAEDECLNIITAAAMRVQKIEPGEPIEAAVMSIISSLVLDGCTMLGKTQGMTVDEALEKLCLVVKLLHEGGLAREA